MNLVHLDPSASATRPERAPLGVAADIASGAYAWASHSKTTSTKAPQARRSSLAETPATYRKQVFSLFLSRLYLAKVAELERPRRHPKALGTPFHLLSGTPSSVPRHRSDRCWARRSAFKCVTTVYGWLNEGEPGMRSRLKRREVRSRVRLYAHRAHNRIGYRHGFQDDSRSNPTA